MKNTLLSAAGVAALLLAGCDKPAPTPAPPTPPPVNAPKPAAGSPTPASPAAAKLSSAEKTSFTEVTSQLDAGGNVYLYLGTEQWLKGLSGKVSDWKETLLSVSSSKNDQREIGQVFDVLGSVTKNSGLEGLSGVGVSSVAIDGGLHRTKLVLHHYPGQGDGYLWHLLGSAPHPLDGLDLLPATTALAVFMDADVPGIWSAVQAEAGRAHVKDVDEGLAMVPDQFEAMTGIPWNRFLSTFGGEFGVVLTLDPARKIRLPNDEIEIQIPEPGLMIVVRVKDETLFNRVEKLLKGQQDLQYTAGTREGWRMLTANVPLPLPMKLSPTLAGNGEYLILGSSDALVAEAIDVRAGRKPGLKSTEEFKKLSAGLPTKGNHVVYVGQQLSQSVREIQKNAIEQLAKKDPEMKILEKFLNLSQVNQTYVVAGKTDQGWVTAGNSTQQGAVMVAGPLLVVPVALMAGIAVPNFVKARTTAQKSACIANLRQIDGAKEQWALENKANSKAVPKAEDLYGVQSYIKHEPHCPAGGIYTLGNMETKPHCSLEDSQGHRIR